MPESKNLESSPESNINPFFQADWHTHKAYILRTFQHHCYLHAISEFGEAGELIGIDSQRAQLSANTQAFAQGKDALHALLWGARGCGKSSLIKATLMPYLTNGDVLRVLEIDSKDIALLPMVFDALRAQKTYRFVVFCDDLSFRAGDSTYKSLKSTLEGSLESRAQNIIVYATSNIRKILESAGADHSPEHSITQEELSLSDRFGLQIGFYDLGAQEYLSYVAHFLQEKIALANAPIITTKYEHPITADIAKSLLEAESPNALRQHALNFATQMGGRNARIARDFVISLCNNIE